MLEVHALEKRAADRFLEIGWKELTPIQRKALPTILRKRSALLVAPTGSGKTEAAVMPIFASLSSEKDHGRGIRMLYITPLRALNRDIFRRMIGYAEKEGLAVEVRHGDTPQSVRRRMAERPPDIMITTPETLAILLTSRRIGQHLKALRWIVVDELHELIGSERGSHLAVSLERVEGISSGAITRIGLSATLGRLDDAGRLLVGQGRRCAILVDDSIRRYDVSCHYVDGPFLKVADHILALVREAARGGKSTLLFCNTRDEAEALGAILRARSPDIHIEVHHGSLSREVREEAEAKLRGGEAGLVICTSSLELGLDIGSVNLVIQFGSPRQAVKLVQRVGRSRHRLGEVAVGAMVTNRPDDELEGLSLIERVRRGSLEINDLHQKPLDVLAHHLVGMALERGSFTVEEALSIFSRAHPFRAIRAEDVDACLRLLDRQGVIRYNGVSVRRRGPRTYRYYYENISTIPDIQQFDVVDVTSNKTIGRLDQMFVGEYGEPGRPFVLKASSWRIVSIDEGEERVYVEPTFKDVSTVPYWVGELIPVDFYTAQEVGRLRGKALSGSEVGADVKQKERLLETRALLGIIPDEKSIVIEKKKGSNAMVVHACLGSKTNQTLATILSTLISSKTGYLVETRSDPYRILLSSIGGLEARHVAEALSGEFELEGILSASVKGTHPMNWRTWHVAKRFGIVSREAQYDGRAARLIQERYADTALHKEVLRELFFDKYDLERAKDVLTRIRLGALRVLERVVQDFSPLSKPILEYAPGFSAPPLSVEKTVLGLVKERLENSKHRLVCLFCGKWEAVVRTVDIREPISCPMCSSRLIADTYIRDEGLLKIVRKKVRGLPLAGDEGRRFRRAWKASSLIQTFGKRALITLSGFGIGADTAARILRGSLEEEELYRNIYRAEKVYVATKGFWRT